jgi:hypothetical protein
LGSTQGTSRLTLHTLVAFAEIDWHDYAIVQTIEFTAADAHAELPPPMSVQEVENMTLAQKRMAAMIMENTAEDVEALRQRQAEGEAAAAAAAASVGLAEEDGDAEMQQSDEEDADETERKRREEEERMREVERARAIQASSLGAGGPMKIRTDYVPKRKRIPIPTRGCMFANSKCGCAQWERRAKTRQQLPAQSVANKFLSTNSRSTCASSYSIHAGSHSATRSKPAKRRRPSFNVAPMSFLHLKISHAHAWIFSAQKPMRSGGGGRRKKRRRGERRGRRSCGMDILRRRCPRKTGSAPTSTSTSKSLRFTGRRV